jgi:hypothetical protein
VASSSMSSMNGMFVSRRTATPAHQLYVAQRHPPDSTT